MPYLAAVDQANSFKSALRFRVRYSHAASISVGARRALAVLGIFELKISTAKSLAKELGCGLETAKRYLRELSSAELIQPRKRGEFYRPALMKGHRAYLPQAWITASDISDAAFSLLACLMTHHNLITGQCDPSIKTLAFKLGRSERSILRLLAELREIGYLHDYDAGFNARYRINLSYVPPDPSPPKESLLTPEGITFDSALIRSEQSEQKEKLTPVGREPSNCLDSVAVFKELRNLGLGDHHKWEWRRVLWKGLVRNKVDLMAMLKDFRKALKRTIDPVNCPEAFLLAEVRKLAKIQPNKAKTAANVIKIEAASKIKAEAEQKAEEERKSRLSERDKWEQTGDNETLSRLNWYDGISAYVRDLPEDIKPLLAKYARTERPPEMSGPHRWRIEEEAKRLLNIHQQAASV